MPIRHPVPHPPPTQVAQAAAETSDDILASLPTDKGELLDAIKQPTLIYIDPVLTFGDDGQITEQDEAWYSAVDGSLQGSKITTWNYYDNGDVNQIEIAEFDADGNQLSDDIIQHYQDETQPVLNPDSPDPGVKTLPSGGLQKL